MARTVPDLCLLLSTMGSDDARDPLATTVHRRSVRLAEDFAVPARVDLSRLRVAITPDFGFALTERHIAEVFAEKTACSAMHFTAPRTRHRIVQARTRPSRCCAR
jgi:amidase